MRLPLVGALPMGTPYPANTELITACDGAFAELAT